MQWSLTHCILRRDATAHSLGAATIRAWRGVDDARAFDRGVNIGIATPLSGRRSW
jgi:hypothetical protein